MAFINRCGGGGGGNNDEEISAFLDRSIEKIVSNVAKVRQYALYSFNFTPAVKTIKLPNVETIEQYAFYQLTSLVKADFGKAKSIETMALYGCSSLETLIIRNAESVCTLADVNTLYCAKFYSSAGHIYVPSDLVSSYKGATYWSDFKSVVRAIEDYPEICG